MNIDTGVIKLLKRKNGFIAKLTEKEIEGLEALKRIRRVKHKPFSPDNTEDNTLAGVFSFEVSEEIDEAIEVGLPSFEDEMDLFADDPDAISADNNPDLIKSARRRGVGFW